MNIDSLNRARNITLAALLAMGLSLPTAGIAYAADDDGDDATTKVKDKLNNLFKDEAQDENAPKKTESVYIFANADGSVKNTVVTNWLKNPTDAAKIHDISSLTDIQNTEGKETFEAKGESLVWDAQGSDIYYQGNTDKKAPVELKVTYWLDGKETPAADMAGKNGHVKIRFDYKNNSTSTEYVAGAARTVYTPFVCVTGMMLDNGVFKNISTKNAKVLNDGDRTMVGGYALPGLQEDLDIDKDTVDLPTYFEIEADVENFEMGTTATIVSSNLLNNLNTDELDTSELGDALNELSDAMGQLIDGTSELYKGMDKLDEGGKKLADGTGELKDKTADLPKSAKQLADGSSELAEGLEGAVDGVDQLSAGNSKITEGLSGAIAGASSIEEGLAAARAGLDNGDSEDPDIGDAVSLANNGVDAISRGIRESLKDTTTADLLTDLGTQLQGAGTETANAGQNLANAGDDITAAATQLGAVMQSEDFAKMTPEQQKAIQSAFNSLTGEDGAAADLTKAGTSIESIGTSLTAAGTDAENVGTALQTTAKSLESIADNLDTVSGALDGASAGIAGVVSGLDKLSAGSGSLTSGLNQLKSGSTDLGTGIDTLGTGLASASEGAGQLAGGLSALNKAVPTLTAGIKALAKGADQLSDGIGAAKEGTGKLKDGIQQLNDEGIQKIVDAYHDNLDGLSDRLKATVDAGKAYNTFTGKSDDMQGNVKFIFETDAIEIDDGEE